jgi:hypothetical protein
MAGSHTVQTFRTMGLGALGILLAGCYTLQPAVGGPPTPGSVIAFDVNDAGRVALGGPMGPEISQIEGRLFDKDSAGDYIVAVSSVRLLRGGEQTWRGERVTIKPEYVGTVYERRFSKSKTMTLGLVGAAVVAAFVTRSLTGLGNPNNPLTPPDSQQTQRRPRR